MKILKCTCRVVIHHGTMTSILQIHGPSIRPVPSIPPLLPVCALFCFPNASRGALMPPPPRMQLVPESLPSPTHRRPSKVEGGSSRYTVKTQEVK